MNGAKRPHSYIPFIAYVKTSLPFTQQTKLRITERIFIQKADTET